VILSVLVYTLYKIIAIFALVAASMFSCSYAEAADLEVKVLDGSSKKEMQIKSFYPEILPVESSNTITWTNEDSVAHSITSGVPKQPDYAGKYFKTGHIKPGESATVKLEYASSFAYYYFCEIHPWLTGKIVFTNTPEAQPETSNPIVASRPNYGKGQDVLISGQVHKDFAKTPYQIQIYENDHLVDTIDGKFADDASYTEKFETKGLDASKYTLKVVYGLPTQVGTTTFLLDSESTIPAWVKNGAKWWSTGKISDSEFASAIQYLAKENVITIQKTQSLVHSNEIPAWLKTNASWWADGIISDSEFTKGLQYLVDSGIIQL
jgi:plastocyanin